MLFSTSLVALILSPRRLQITNTKVRPHVLTLYQYLVSKQYEDDEYRPRLAFHIASGATLTGSHFLQRQSTICELTFPTTVLAVRMNRKRLVVILEDQIYLYDISNMKLLFTIETSPNPNGMCGWSNLSSMSSNTSSYMCSVTFLEQLLPSLPSSTESGALILRSSVPCPTRGYTHCSYQWGRSLVRYPKARSNQCGGSTSLTSVMHHCE